MLAEKEKQLKHYHKLSINLLTALKEGRDEEIGVLLDQRDACIASINQLDKNEGSLLMNKPIKNQLAELLVLEQKIEKHMQQTLKKMAKNIRDVRNEQYVTKQYDEYMPVSVGYFYDKKK